MNIQLKWHAVACVDVRCLLDRKAGICSEHECTACNWGDSRLMICLQGGFVWLFYGGTNFPVDERPPIPYVPELDDPTWKPVYGMLHTKAVMI